MAITNEQRALIEAVAGAVDAERPGLRERNLEEWMQIVSWRCHQQDARIGRKSAGGGRPISKDTIGVLEPEVGPERFSAVSIARDDHPGGNPRRWLEYGIVGAEQRWIKPARPASEPVAPPPPFTPPPADDEDDAVVNALVAHTAALNRIAAVLEKLAAQGIKVSV